VSAPSATLSTTGRRRSQLPLTRKLKITLDQRIAVRYTMPGMTPEETASYITHHIKLAGRTDPIFSDDATTLIHDTSRGLPRAVSNLAIAALIAAYASRKAIVDESSARTAATEITSD
jgi:type II secretory pathway predicted ATPase ExeA